MFIRSIKKFFLLVFLSLIIYSCGEAPKIKTLTKKNMQINTDKVIHANVYPLTKKVFIEECNNYLSKNKVSNLYLLNYLCNNRCGYSCLNLYSLKNDKNLLEKGINYLKLECKNNIKSSCLILGDYYANSDLEKAKNYLLKGCNLKDGKACYKLALIDRINFVKYMSKGCSIGYKTACFNLGVLFYKNGKIDNAINFLKESCNKDILKGCFLLAKIFIKDKKNIKLAKEYLDKSCKLNSENACLYIGYLFYSGKALKKDKNKALDYFKYACDKYQSPKGCSLTGVILYSKKDFINSISYLNKGCNLKDGGGCLSLSLLLLRGKILNKNPELSKEYLKLAKKYGVDNDILNYLCKSGLEEACK